MSILVQLLSRSISGDLFLARNPQSKKDAIMGKFLPDEIFGEFFKEGVEIKRSTHPYVLRESAKSEKVKNR